MNPEGSAGDRKRWPWMPDFFIAGAMKCGTTTLHAMLAEHPHIFIPRGEVFFFDIDDCVAILDELVREPARVLAEACRFLMRGGTGTSNDFVIPEEGSWP